MRKKKRFKFPKEIPKSLRSKYREIVKLIKIQTVATRRVIIEANEKDSSTHQGTNISSPIL